MHKPPLAIVLLMLLLMPCVRAEADAPQCQQHLIVHLTPDVPNPADAGFLSSLVTIPYYRLVWVRKVSDDIVALDLSGPGTADDCTRVIEAMRRDSHVVSIELGGGAT
jgi:hypothetical protein